MTTTEKKRKNGDTGGRGNARRTQDAVSLFLWHTTDHIVYCNHGHARKVQQLTRSFNYCVRAKRATGRSIACHANIIGKDWKTLVTSHSAQFEINRLREIDQGGQRHNRKQPSRHDGMIRYGSRVRVGCDDRCEMRRVPNQRTDLVSRPCKTRKGSNMMGRTLCTSDKTTRVVGTRFLENWTTSKSRHHN